MTDTLLNTSAPPAAGLLRVPGWERYGWLRASFSTRQGGHSLVYGPYEQNLGWTAEDDPGTVAANRRNFALAVSEGITASPVTVRQVHGTRVRTLESEPEPWMTREGKTRLEGDGLTTGAARNLVAVLTADCVPVLLADTRTHAVAALHAGWRGTCAEMARAGVSAMQRAYGSRAEDLIAAVGPCIQSCCFQVGAEVRTAFLSAASGNEAFFSTAPDDTLSLDLQAANRRQLVQAGIAEANIGCIDLCTACARTSSRQRLFFSHRAERGITGRMLSGIMAVS